MYAAFGGHGETVKLLIGAGAAVNIQDEVSGTE